MAQPPGACCYRLLSFDFRLRIPTLATFMFDAETWAKGLFTSVRGAVLVRLHGWQFLERLHYRMPMGKGVISPPSHCPHLIIRFHLSSISACDVAHVARQMRQLPRADFRTLFPRELLTGLMFLACWLHYGRQSPALALVYCLVMAD